MAGTYDDSNSATQPTQQRNRPGGEMKPYHEDEQATIYCGDCREILQTLPNDSVDAVVTDPPYGLAFMGKRWDYDVPSIEVWAECLRILKPGGHLLAFAGTRTQHRMAVRIEDAGFEIRDMIAWVYGSGFPKSLDVSKAIDGSDAAKAQQKRRHRFTEWVRSQGVTSAAIDAATNTSMGGHYTTTASQPAIMTREHLEQCRHLFSHVPEWVERECDKRSVESENMKRREVVGRSENGIAGGTGKHAGEGGAYGFAGDFNITAPATESAKQWSGWGTALKPALEPITVARKPLCGTVAENVLRYGTGGINVDGCRVSMGDEYDPAKVQRQTENSTFQGRGAGHEQPTYNSAGRWPANLIHDGSAEVTGLFPETKGQQGAVTGSEPSSKTANAFGEYSARSPSELRGDTGSAARFYYTAKADKADRGHGNTHPTVKPQALMRYLVRLVCPPGGVVLDPFGGSGTTAAAARLEQCRSILCELSAEYCNIAVERLRQRVLF